MALAKNRPLNVVRVFAYMADSSTAGSAFAVSPCRGKIIKMGSVIGAALTVADTAITSKVAGAAVTGGGWTIAFTSAAAGDVDTAIPAAANAVNEDDNIEFISDGGGTTTCPTTFFADILVA